MCVFDGHVQMFFRPWSTNGQTLFYTFLVLWEIIHQNQEVCLTCATYSVGNPFILNRLRESNLFLKIQLKSLKYFNEKTLLLNVCPIYFMVSNSSLTATVYILYHFKNT